MLCCWVSSTGNSEDCSAFIFQKQAGFSSDLYCFILIDPEAEHTMILQNTEVWLYSMMHCRDAEDLNLHQHYCKNLEYSFKNITLNFSVHVFMVMLNIWKQK
jgi:hypothetical protein